MFPNGTIIPILYHDSLPFIPVRRPTPSKIESCCRLQLTMRDEYEPYHLQQRLAVLKVNTGLSIPSVYTDPFSLKLMASRLKERADSH